MATYAELLEDIKQHPEKYVKLVKKTSATVYEIELPTDPTERWSIRVLGPSSVDNGTISKFNTIIYCNDDVVTRTIHDGVAESTLIREIRNFLQDSMDEYSRIGIV